MFGRRPRVKSHEQVGRELDALRAQGVRRVFFVDDNLIGNKPQAKELMRQVAVFTLKDQGTGGGTGRPVSRPTFAGSTAQASPKSAEEKTVAKQPAMAAAGTGQGGTAKHDDFEEF